MAFLQNRHFGNTPGALPFDCTPSSILASTPCVACLSEKELLAALVAIIAVSKSKTLKQVLEDSACFTCMSDKQLLQAIVVIFGNGLLGETHTIQEVIDEMHCLVCASDKQLKASLVQLLCEDVSLAVQ